MTNLIKIKEEINNSLGDKETFQALVTTTFKGLEVGNVKKAIFEGMMRGFTFKDFLEKNIYAIPFKTGYSLVTSIDYARKTGMRSGIVGKSAPSFEEKDGKIISCTVTVKRKVGGHIGDYTATVFFKEYYKEGKNGYPSLWDSKAHTMISKVAEMHALRMACPEELSQIYIEEDIEKEVEPKILDTTTYKEKLESVKNLDELKTVWASLPVEAKGQLSALKDELKNKYEDK